MSDLSIPGVTDTYNTQKIIDALMAVEKEPLTRVQKELATEQQKKTAWQDISRSLSSLRDMARVLFGFQNPFNDRIATSSNEAALTATANRQATEETKKILVEKVATADRFLSRSLPRDFTVDPGKYTFHVGDKEVTLAWKGGTLKAFADALNAKGGDVLAASVVNDSSSTQVILIEGKLTGSSNRLTFLDSAVDLGVKAGMLQRSPNASRSVTLDANTPAAWTAPLSKDGFSVQNGTLVVNPGQELKIPLQPSVALNKNMVLELSVKVEKLPEQTAETAKPPPGPSIPATGGIDYQGIHIDNEPSQTPLPEWKAPEPPPNVTDMNALFMEGDGKVTPLPAVPDSAEFQTIQIPIGEMASSISSIDIRNRNTYRKIDVKDITIYDTTQRGDYVPSHPLSEAGDAQIAMDGIEVKRGTNAIDDLLPGVTVTLKAPSDTPVTLTVAHDVAGIKTQVENLVGSYDGIITDIDVLTRKDDSIIANATYLSEEEKKKATANLGLLMGDMSLTQLKSSMQLVMMNSYPTSLGSALNLLAQIGISTDNRSPGSAGIDKTKLRGYLEVDEPKLVAAVQNNAEAVKQLFGYDTTGDLVVDSGVAFRLDELLRPYVQTGGLLSQRIATLDTQIDGSNKQIATLQEKIAAKEAELKQKYAEMDSSLNSLKETSSSIKNFSNSNNSSQ